MIETIKRTVRLISVGAFFICMSSSVGTFAQSSETKEATSSQPTITVYSYTTQAGDSLTRMARHALQVYEKSRNLTSVPAVSAFCESATSRALGSTRLEIGQQIKIPATLLEECLVASKSLTPEQLAGWQTYASQISFDTSDMHTDTAAAPPVTSAEPTTGTTDDQFEIPNTDEAKQDDDAKTTSDRNLTYYWLIGTAAVLAILYFILADKFANWRTK